MKDVEQMKKRVLFCLLAAGCALEAKDVWQAAVPEDWSIRKPVINGQKVFVHKSGQSLIASKSIKVSSDKKYIISGDFRLTGAKTPGPLYFGFVPCNKDNKEFGFQHVSKIKGTSLATVAQNAQAGDTQIILKKSISWPVKKGSYVLALNAKSDDTDLPNLDIVSVKSIRHEDSKTVVTLTKKLTKNVAKDSLVRLQGYGASFLYAGCAGKKISDTWQTFKGEISFDTGKVCWLPGTAFAKVAFWSIAKTGNIEFRNIKVEEVATSMAVILPNQINIATKNSGAVVTVSDSAEADIYRPASMYDNNEKTAWLSGAVQNDHDIEINWFNSNVTAGGIFLNFTPVGYQYKETVGYLSHLSGYKPKSYKGTSTLPKKIKIEVKQYNKWKTLGEFPVNNTLFYYRFPQILHDVQRIKVSFNATVNKRVAIREIQISGSLGNKNKALRNVPTFSSSGAYFIWAGGATTPIPTNQKVSAYFRTLFKMQGKEPIEAVLSAAAYNKAEIFLNGKSVLVTAFTIPESKPQVNRVNIPISLLKEENLLACRTDKIDISSGLHGVAYQLVIKCKDGSFIVAASNGKTTTSSLKLEPNWNTQLAGFSQWKMAHNRYFSRGYPADYWALDYSEPFFSDEVELVSWKLEPKIPVPGQRYKLELEFNIPKALKKNYVVSARFGQLPVELYASFAMGATCTEPGESLYATEKGTKKVVLTGSWPEEVPNALPCRIAVANGKEQAFIKTVQGKMLSGPIAGQVELLLGEKLVTLPKDFPKGQLKDSIYYLDGKRQGLFFFGANKLSAGQVADQLDNQAIQMLRIGRMSFVTDQENMQSSQDTYVKVFEMIAQYSLQKNPNTKFMLVLSIDPLADWLFNNPDEQIELGDGSRLMGFYNNRGTGNLQVRASMASEKYRQLVYDSVYKLISRIRKHPYANSVVAVAIAAGLAHENNWGVDRYDFTKGKRTRNSSMTGDFGVAARKALVKFLQKRYKTNDAWVKAWKLDKDAKFSDLLSFSTWSHQRIQNIMLWRDRPQDRFIFRDGQKDGRSAEDLNEFCSLQRAEMMLVTAKAVKDASARRLLVGGYAGYVFPQLINNPVGSSVYSGHAAAKMLRESNNFDYFSSPQWCHSLDLPIFYSVLNDSLRLYGKTFIVEGDIRTHSAAFGGMYSRKYMVSQLRKVSGLMLAKRFGAWFLGWSYSFSGPQGVRFFSDSALLSELKNLRENSALEPLPYEKGNRIALLVSEQSSYFMDLMSPANTVHARLLYRNLHKFLRTGAGCDIMALEDLPQLVKTGRLNDYKFVAFYNAFHLNKELRSIINTKVKADNRTVLFFYAPGYHDDSFNKNGSSLSTAGIANLIGVDKVAMIPKDYIIGAQWKNGEKVDCDIWWDKNQIETFSQKIGPVFYLPQDAKVENFAALRLDGKVNNDKIAAAKIKKKDHTVFYVAVPDIPQDMLNSLVKESGTVIAADGKVIVNCGAGYLTVTNQDKNRNVTLKAVDNFDWYEMPGNIKRASNTNKLVLPFKYNETRLFRLVK